MTGICRQKVRGRLKKCVLTFLTLLIAIFVALFPERSSRAVIGGINLFYEKLFPALFPMCIVSGILSRSGSLPGFLINGISKCLGISKATATAFVIGILSGFPIGGMLIGQLYERGEIEKDEAERMVGVCTCPSPAFLIVSVGSFLLHNKMLGVALWLGQITATILVAIVSGKGNEHPNGYVAKSKPLPVTKDICDSIGRAAQSMLSVIAFICFFSLLCEMICGSLPSHMIGLRTMISGFLEIGSGMSAAARFDYPANLCICAVFAGWSGLSVHMQTASLLGSLSIKRCVKQKIALAVISVPLTLLYAELLSKLSPQL